MKNIKTFTVQFFLFLLLIACKSLINGDDLIGTWKVIEFSADMPDVSPVLIQESKDIALSTVYTYNSDNSMLRISEVESKADVGSFELLDEGMRIIMMFDTEGYNSDEKYEIVSYNGKTMRWKYNYGELGSLVMKLKKQ